ncbi:MAG: FAD:protein FMN transferase [Dehalococcoidia bacterium]
MPPELARLTFPAMGGSVDVQIAGGAAEDAARVEALFAAHERALSRFLPDSEVCALNRATGAPFAASPLLFDIVSEACGWACVTGGAFDPTVLEALEAAGYDRPFDEVAGRTALLERPRTQTGRWREIAFDFDHDRITLPAGVRVDLGGIGKGYTVDRAIETLPARTGAMVNASGDLYAAGDGPAGDGWRVGVADPRAPERDLAAIVVRDRGVATSGSSKRRWGTGDRRYHHLIDPREGTSSEGDLLAVTVIARSATEANVLAKTAFLLGSSAGPRFVERSAGCGTLAVTLRGELLMSDGFREYLA